MRTAETRGPTRADDEPLPWRRGDGSGALRFAGRSGTLTDSRGRGAILAPKKWLAEFRNALLREIGDRADDILRKIGAAWGSADMEAFMARAPEEFGVELAKVHMGVALQTWWRRFAAGGWGEAEFDSGRPKQRWLRVTLRHSGKGPAEPGKALGAGLLAGAFGRLSGRELAGVALRAEVGDECTVFLIGTPARAAEITRLRDDGLTADEIEARLAE